MTPDRCVVPIGDLNRPGNAPGQVPDPFGAVAGNDFLFRSAPAALPGFQVNAPSERFGGFDVRRRFEPQPPGQRRGACLMHGRSHRHLDGLQIRAPRLAALVKDHAQHSIYFARDFLVDGCCRFFPGGVKVSSTRRDRQIRSLSSTKDRLSRCQRRNASISRSAFRCAAGLAKLSVTVLRFVL
jgi:hypothetical protein